jgi:hypothetical protein
MWRDLDASLWPADRQPAANALVHEVLRGSVVTGDGFGFPDEHDIDDTAVEASAPVLVHDADSSQHSAIIDVMRGKNLVIEGPRGHRQIADDREPDRERGLRWPEVLFVAEKQAALTVVKARLDAAGLGDFCLEIYSAKTRPREVAASLKARSEVRGRSPQPRDGRALAATRDLLNAHCRALHQQRTAGRASAFELFGRERATADALDAATRASTAGVELPDAAGWDEAQLAVRRRLARELAGAASAWGQRGRTPVPRPPWRRFAWTMSILSLLGRRSSRPQDASPAWPYRLAEQRDRLPLAERDRLSLAGISALAGKLSRLPRLPTAAEGVQLDQLLAPGFKARLSDAAQRLRTIGELDRLLAAPAPPRLDPATVERAMA